MKIPKSITVKGSKYKIKIQNEEIIDPTDGNPCRGLAMFDEKVILLEKSDDYSMFQTLVHETIHLIIREVHISLNEDIEESLCEAISTEMIRIFKLK